MQASLPARDVLTRKYKTGPVCYAVHCVRLRRHLVPQFRHAQAGLLRDAQRYGMNSTSATLLARQPWRNGFNPTGPLLFSNWEVDYSLWQVRTSAVGHTRMNTTYRHRYTLTMHR